MRIMNKIKLIDPILLISLILMIISCCFTKNLNIVNAIDFKVIAMLLSLMIVIESLKELDFFNYLSQKLIAKLNNTRSLSFVLINLCFFSSMLITNDVALITFVPLSLLILKNINSLKLIIDVIVLETIAANLGSQLTPLGNPQNLYLFTHFNLDLIQFLRIMFLPSLISLLILWFMVGCLEKIQIVTFDQNEFNLNKGQLIIWISAFCLCFMSILQLISYQLLLVVIILLALIFNFRALKKVDYSILFTFICLFIFIDNILQLDFIQLFIFPLIKNYTYISSLLISQFISNVPAAILCTPLSNDYKSLLYGVNIGGVGTLIASMASVISYKLFCQKYAKFQWSYLKRFSIYNLGFLVILGFFGYLLLIFK